MLFQVVTPFPEMFESVFSQSIVKRAIDTGVVKVETFDLRRFTTDKHNTIDDYQFGGGPGMVMKPDPLFKTLEFLLQGSSDKPLIYLLSAKGKTFNQVKADELTGFDRIILVCGHYKGVDQRFIDKFIDEEISIGDYVLSGGEIPAMVIIDAVVRLIPGAISDPESALTDSFRNGLLEGPIYTRPEDFRGLSVPEILMSGHHAKIEEWRKEKSIETTRKHRPDLLDNKDFSTEN
jgi:tRNA (guanine37-N1)-methyltransferase